MRRELQLDWVSSFLAVVDQETFTAAAHVVHRSQPRVSAHVSALESALGVSLLHRSGTRVTLTEAGRLFLPRARSAVLELETAAGEVNELSALTRGHVTIGSYPSASATVLAPVLQQFTGEYPGVSFSVHEGPATWAETAVADGTVDVAIRGRDPAPRSPHVTGRPLFEEPVVAVVPPAHPMADESRLLTDGFGDGRVLTTGEPGRGPGIGYDYEPLLQKVGIGVEQRVLLSQATTLVAMVRAGLGVGVLGALAAQMAGTESLVVRRFPRKDPYLRYISVFWDRSRRRSPAAAALLRHVCAASPPPGVEAV